MLCIGEKVGVNDCLLHYKGTKFHSVVRYYRAIGGKLDNDYGPSFDDEHFDYSHDEPGILSM